MLLGRGNGKAYVTKSVPFDPFETGQHKVWEILSACVYGARAAKWPNATIFYDLK
jgi:hypothetical protein